MRSDLVAMTVNDLDRVMSIETRAYSHPWTRGNFVDSLAAGHLARMRLDRQGRCIGYFVAMRGVGEVHLLNLTVEPAMQRRGEGTAMLRALCEESRGLGLRTMILEVRESNLAARGLYARCGFVDVGRRREYYPSGPGVREDAVVMALGLTGGDGDALD